MGANSPRRRPIICFCTVTSLKPFPMCTLKRMPTICGRMWVARFMAVRNHAPIGLDAWDRLRRWAGDLPLATTAKDYARIAHLPGADQVWWLDQAATFEDPSLVVPEDKFPRSDREPQGCVQGGSS